MSDRSSIEWTEATWNPTRGCVKISPGCKHCYAEAFAERFRGVKGHPYERGFDPRLVPEALTLPLRWTKPRRIFVDSMSDLFQEAVSDEYLLQVFDVIRRCHTERPGHVFQVLTKRAARMQDFCARLRWDDEGEGRLWLSSTPAPSGFAPPGDGYALVRALTNLELGASVENQPAADERIPQLLATPAALRFLSCEPLLGPVDLDMIVTEGLGCIDWVIVGGESGPKARPCDVAWIRSIVAQCRAAGVAAFCKQLGANIKDRNDAGFDGDTATSWPMGTDPEHDDSDTGYQGAPVRVRLRDRKGGDPAEWPADLRVREMPEVRR